MARIVKEEEYAARRNQILDVARRLIFTKGYEQMSIQDILDELQISKGAFYHYFDSKATLLEALVERMMIEEVEPLVIPIVQDPHLSAIEKLHRYFDLSLRWKSAQKPFMLALLRVWLADENAILRQKMVTMTIKRVTPLLTEIIRQGVQEGVFTTSYPDQVCHVMIYILQGSSDTIMDLLLSSETSRDVDVHYIESAIASYSDALADAMERILGAPKGSLQLLDKETMMEWFVSPTKTPSVQTQPELT